MYQMCGIFVTQCEEVAQKTKENMEVQLQRQAQLHKENMQNIQNRFNMQVQTTTSYIIMIVNRYKLEMELHMCQ